LGRLALVHVADGQLVLVLGDVDRKQAGLDGELADHFVELAFLSQLVVIQLGNEPPLFVLGSNQLFLRNPQLGS